MIGRIASLLHIKEPAPQHKGILLTSGTTVPVDGASGYATGCLFQKTDGGAGTALYCNEGTLASSNFDAVTVA